MEKVLFEFEPIGYLGENILVQEMRGNGETYFRVTKLYRASDGSRRPTNKGISVPLEKCVLLRRYLDKFIEKHGLSGDSVTDSSDASDPSPVGDLSLLD